MNEPNRPSEPGGGGDRAEAKARWSPYRVCIGMGVLNWFAFSLVNQPLGISTARCGPLELEKFLQ